MIRHIFASFIFFFYFTIKAVSLNGPQHGEYERREYHVSETVVVPAGKIMTIHPGSIVRFEQYTGLIVRGALVCKSDTFRGVLFTAARSGDDYAAWNGIEVDSGGSVHLENCYVYSSVYGIKLSGSCGSVGIKNTRFRDNESDFSVGDSVVVIEKKAPFNWSRNVTPEFKETTGVSAANEEGDAVKRRWKIPVRISLGAVAVAGGVLCAVFHNKYDDYRMRYPDAVEDAAEIREKGNNALYRRNAWGIIGGAALCGFTVTFLF
jgi:hypothetical protein